MFWAFMKYREKYEVISDVLSSKKKYEVSVNPFLKLIYFIPLRSVSLLRLDISYLRVPIIYM